MATKKDLVEAHTFSRRRLVTAFVSGAPGGREVEPTRPGRVLIGGVAISVLLLAGAAIAGFLLGRPNSQWLEKGSFVISKDTGEQYVVLNTEPDPVIQRVPNYLSAQLLLGDAELTPFTVRDKYIRKVTLGPDLGIEGAPAGLPAADELVQGGWTACTAPEQGIKVTVTREPEVTELRFSSFLVESGGKHWLIAASPGVDVGAHRFEMPPDSTDADTFADRLGFSALEAAPVVAEDWLNLFPAGPPLTLDAFGLTSVGEPVNYPESESDLKGLETGDLVRTHSGNFYLLGSDGPQLLSEFAAQLYDAVGGRPVQELPGDLHVERAPEEFPSEWPSRLPEPAGTGDLCAVLYPSEDAGSRVVLADSAEGRASPDDISRNEHEVVVEPSGGAYVEAGADEASTEGTAYVIDAKGAKYPLVGPLVADYIGYGEATPTVVPSSWMRFFEDGVTLSLNAARRVPEDAPDQGQTQEATQ
ncbi:hypothetical protein DDE18_12895 [Nocardioides gansuensis]|uniref:Type VII secretion protein EccB n=1 Tax=Nocardioides gansuensis TaxID=2138300 RepID=A0A2T8F9I1_9ACTN|nr:type VII secretion protein EccB [Nocardioides gansuensis]PVG82372.1 hypothetical protein DDE18_12895 [Nocardioides gansuensis]